MSQHDDDRLDAYLWDPAAEPHEDVSGLEEKLRIFRLKAEATPDFRLKPEATPEKVRSERVRSERDTSERDRVWLPPSGGRRKWLPPSAGRLLAAAAVLILAVGGWAAWRWTWPADRAWDVVSGTASAPGDLAVGRTLTVPASGDTVVNVARIGRMRIAGGSALTLRSTRSNRHLLTLERGSVHVRVWAPPFSVVFQTPAGEVLDMGCEFDLEVAGTSARVRVTSGWVQLENDVDEILVPAGASTEMHRGTYPGVPVFDDAAPGFREAVRALESGTANQVERVASLARPRDMLTLLLLIERRVEGTEQIATRAATLWPPPKDVTVSRIVRGDVDALWRWRDTLPLPPVKGWWLNWKDALPRWLAQQREAPGDTVNQPRTPQR